MASEDETNGSKKWVAENAVGVAGVLVSLIGLFVAQQTTSIVSNTWNFFLDNNDTEEMTEEIALLDDELPDGTGLPLLPVIDEQILMLSADAAVDTDTEGVVQTWEGDSGIRLSNENQDPDIRVIDSAIGGRNAIRFDHNFSNDKPGLVGTAAGLPGGNADRTVMMVVNFNGGNYDNGVFWGSPGVDGRVFGLGTGTVGCVSSSQLTVFSNESVCNTRASAEPIPLDYVVVTAVIGRGSTDMFLNGEKVHTTVHVHDTGSRELWVNGDMDVAAIVIWSSALSDDEVLGAFDTLAEHYQL